MEPNAVKIGCVDVPSSSPMFLAVSPPAPLARTTRSAASTISVFVNLFFGAIVCASPGENKTFNTYRTICIVHYTRTELRCQPLARVFPYGRSSSGSPIFRQKSCSRRSSGAGVFRPQRLCLHREPLRHRLPEVGGKTARFHICEASFQSG